MTDVNEIKLEELLKETLPETSLAENLGVINPLGAAVTIFCRRWESC